MAKMLPEAAFMEIVDYCVDPLARAAALRMYAAHAADAEPVIRCNDCALNTESDCAMRFGDSKWNAPHDYCSWAK